MEENDMPSGENKVGLLRQLCELTECGVCLRTLKDPRMLPCIHTFCFDCLVETREKSDNSPGDVRMPCPVCRKEFTIPLPDGFPGIQKNFFVERLTEMTTLQGHSSTFNPCDICWSDSNAMDDSETPSAVQYCIECCDKLCEDCARHHRKHRLSRNHTLVEVGSSFEWETMKQVSPVTNCTQHPNRPLEIYCNDCRSLVCVLCLVGSHQGHRGSEVSVAAQEFSREIGRDADLISTYHALISPILQQMRHRRDRFLEHTDETEKAIQHASNELKERINRQAMALLRKLSVIKRNRLRQMKSEREDVELHAAILRSFRMYCIEVQSKGSPGDICRAKDELRSRAGELVELLRGRQVSSVKVTFKAANRIDAMTSLLRWKSHRLKRFSRSHKADSVIGRITVETKFVAQLESFLLIVGLSDSSVVSNDIVRVSLHRPKTSSSVNQIPTEVMQRETVADVRHNTIYVTGTGKDKNEIWRYDLTSGWTRCQSLVQGRRRHCTSFADDDVLYICGGYVDSSRCTLDSIEAFDTLQNTCRSVGQLVRGVKNASCVFYKSSVFVFGGSDGDNRAVDCVQEFNTLSSTCSLLSTRMPCPLTLMRSVRWRESAILLACWTCFVYDFERGRWQERDQFRSDVVHFGMTVDDDRLFVVGGGIVETDGEGRKRMRCRDDVRFVPVPDVIDDKPVAWRHHSRLPKPSMLYACARIIATA